MSASIWLLLYVYKLTDVYVIVNKTGIVIVIISFNFMISRIFKDLHVFCWFWNSKPWLCFQFWHFCRHKYIIDESASKKKPHPSVCYSKHQKSSQNITWCLILGGIKVRLCCLYCIVEMKPPPTHKHTHTCRVYFTQNTHKRRKFEKLFKFGMQVKYCDPLLHRFVLPWPFSND